jgi:hypothetical protein
MPSNPLIPVLAIGGGLALLVGLRGNGKKPAPTPSDSNTFACPALDASWDANTKMITLRKQDAIKATIEATAKQLGITDAAGRDKNKKALISAGVKALAPDATCNWDALADAWIALDQPKIKLMSEPTAAALKLAEQFTNALKFNALSCFGALSTYDEANGTVRAATQVVIQEAMGKAIQDNKIETSAQLDDYANQKKIYIAGLRAAVPSEACDWNAIVEAWFSFDAAKGAQMSDATLALLQFVQDTIESYK